MRTEGYISDIEYTRGFYREMTPEHLSFVCLLRGVPAPRLDLPFSYCELGCGQGITLLVLAATHPQASFLGIDFNPAHIAYARRLAEAAGIRNVEFRETSFRALASERLWAPAYDFLALHGVYSWVAPENRQAIVEIAENRLKPGGILYVSYNTPPGWAVMGPIQTLLSEQAGLIAGRSDQRFERGRQLLARLQEAAIPYFTLFPAAADKIGRWQQLDRRYLAHEYLNEHWRPVHHAAVARDFEPARLAHIGSATVAENFDDLCLSPAVRDLILAAEDGRFAETLREFALCQTFRRDIFVRGPARMSGAEVKNTFRQVRLALQVPADAVSLAFPIPLGRIEIEPGIGRAATQALAAGPASVADLENLPEVRAMPTGAPTLFQLVYLLVGAGMAAPTTYLSPESGAAARRFNRWVADRISFEPDLNFFAAPMTGTALITDTVERMVYAGLAAGHPASADRLASYAARLSVERDLPVFAEDGARIVEETLILQRLLEPVNTVIRQKWPLWTSLGLI